jgi:N-acetylglucosaminyldiphosphoundecaprenol N-acetyl-beta-D-mannosaminyltransferase
VTLLGVDFDRLSEREVLSRIGDGLENGDGGWIVTPNVDILRQAVHDPDCRALLEAATLVLADGMPLVWASRLQGSPLPERVAGSDLALSVPALAAERGASVFLLGGEPGVAERAGKELLARFPGLILAGTHCPPHGFEHDPGEMAHIVDVVGSAQPQILIVALGFPKQERLIAQIREVLPQTWMLGLGISLSFVVGEVRRAPRVLHVLGLEWLHRFAQEPRRLARRYFVHGLPFALRLLGTSTLVGLRRRTSGRGEPADN